jgi:hypothetical protein
VKSFLILGHCLGSHLRATNGLDGALSALVRLVIPPTRSRGGSSRSESRLGLLGPSLRLVRPRSAIRSVSFRTSFALVRNFVRSRSEFRSVSFGTSFGLVQNFVRSRSELRSLSFGTSFGLVQFHVAVTLSKQRLSTRANAASTSAILAPIIEWADPTTLDHAPDRAYGSHSR